jgi:SAM-dependent methyltransferase
MPEPAPEVSPALQAFIAEAPVARGPHVPFLRDALADLPDGSLVLDVGAGDAPYRELFARHDYRTTDWGGSFYAPEQAVDHVAPANELPLETGRVDAVVCTQVLEHLAEPGEALDEFHRVLRPGGRLIITVPLTWYLHELPHDFYRYTSYGRRHILERAGFVEIEISPMNDSPSTIAELLRHLRWILGRADDGLDERRIAAGDLLSRAATMVESVGWLDTQWLLPMSFSATARTPEVAPA